MFKNMIDFMMEKDEDKRELKGALGNLAHRSWFLLFVAVMTIALVHRKNESITSNYDYVFYATHVVMLVLCFFFSQRLVKNMSRGIVMHVSNVKNIEGIEYTIGFSGIILWSTAIFLHASGYMMPYIVAFFYEFLAVFVHLFAIMTKMAIKLKEEQALTI